MGSAGAVLDFAGLLETLGFTDSEFVSVCHQVGAGGQFRAAVMRPSTAPGHVSDLPTEADVWFGVNPVRGPARTDAGRGGAADVTRLAALVADLDVKPSGCGSFRTAEAIIGDLSVALREYPVAITHSGHGLHPYWAIGDGRICETFTTGQAASLVRRWGRLVRSVAETRNANVDSVFDLPRVLRVPGMFNHRPAA
ncbi:MAG TPA: hypothetical protein VEF72_12175 [Mycobacterium sp.]|nr:hypothetical protein [Mycobacterium sp.]